MSSADVDVIANIAAIFTQFNSEFTTLAGTIAGTAIFLLPVGIKFTGKTIGFVKSLAGTGGRRRR